MAAQDTTPTTDPATAPPSQPSDTAAPAMTTVAVSGGTGNGVPADTGTSGETPARASAEQFTEAVIRTIAESSRDAATKTGLYGVVIQIVGLVMIGFALSEPEWGDPRVLTTNEFMTVVIAGAALIAVGPYVGKAAAPKVPDAGELVAQVSAEVDGRQTAEVERRKREARDKAASADRGGT